MYWLLALLILSGTASAQPMEAPWVITEGPDSASIRWPLICGDGSAAVQVFSLQRLGEEQRLWQHRLHVAEFSVADSQEYLIEDTLSCQLTSAVISGNGRWAISFYASQGPATEVGVFTGDSSSAEEMVLDSGWHGSGPNVRGTWVRPPSVVSWNAEGCIVHWLGGNDDNWAGEPHQVGQVCFVPSLSSSGDHTTRSCLLGDFLYGPAVMAVRPFESDSVAVIQSLSPTYPGWGDPVLGVLDTNMGGVEHVMLCAEQPIEIAQTPGGNWLLLANLGVTHSFSFDLSGDCAEAGTFGGISAAYWHELFGFVMLNASNTSIQLVRTDTSGAMTHPEGVFYWRDSEHIISSANVAITDSGLVVVVWTERNESTGRERLMLGTVGWDTPLAVDRRPEATASSYDLSAYPNPFNGTLEIRYELPRAEKVQVAVFNVLGQKVAQLEDGMRSAGTHHVSWMAETGSGIYLVSLQTEQGMRTEKVLLAR